MPPALTPNSIYRHRAKADGGLNGVAYGADVPSTTLPPERIAFDDDVGVWIMSGDGTGQTRICNGKVPAWSSDGTKVAFMRSDGLYVVNSNGSGVAKVPGTVAGDAEPCFSPDRHPADLQ